MGTDGYPYIKRQTIDYRVHILCLDITCHDLAPAMESVVLETNLGNFELELYWNHAPVVNA